MRREDSGDCLASCMQMTGFFCGEWEEDLRATVGRFADMCRRRGLKVKAAKSKVMVLHGEEGLECKVHVDGIRLEQVSEFK